MAESEPPDSSIHVDPSPKNIPKVITTTTPLHTNDIDTFARYTLPFRHNRGKPPNRYPLMRRNELQNTQLLIMS